MEYTATSINFRQQHVSQRGTGNRVDRAIAAHGKASAGFFKPTVEIMGRLIADKLAGA